MIYTTINGIDLKFITSPNVFSPKQIDKGTLSMLSIIQFDVNDYILDLGCGYGVVGIYAAHFVNPENIVMSDISSEAIEFATYNVELNNLKGIKIVESDGLDNINEEGFSKIIANPPYHVDFSVPKNYIEKGYKKLKYGGKLYLVTKRREWYKNKIISVFGGVKIIDIDGYYVFEAEKRESNVKIKKTKKNRLSKKLNRKMQKMK